MPGEMQRPGLRMNLADRVAIFEQQVQMIKEFKRLKWNLTFSVLLVQFGDET